MLAIFLALFVQRAEVCTLGTFAAAGCLLVKAGFGDAAVSSISKACLSAGVVLGYALVVLGAVKVIGVTFLVARSCVGDARVGGCAVPLVPVVALLVAGLRGRVIASVGLLAPPGRLNTAVIIVVEVVFFFDLIVEIDVSQRALFARCPVQNWIQIERTLSIAWLGFTLTKFLSSAPHLSFLAFGAFLLSGCFIHIAHLACLPVFAEHGRRVEALVHAGIGFGCADNLVREPRAVGAQVALHVVEAHAGVVPTAKGAGLHKAGVKERNQAEEEVMSRHGCD